MDNDISLVPFDIHLECPPEDKKFFHRNILNLKTNFFLDTKPLSQNTLFKHHLAHYIPAIILSTDQTKKYIFHVSDENGRTITQYNNHNGCNREKIVI